MHSKYIIRDNAAVWMGSANFTEDGWGLQDNNVLVFEQAPDLAAYYTTDFDDLWHYGRIAGTGKNDNGTLVIDGDNLSVDFSPGDGKAIDSALASLIDSAKTSLHVASMVISSTAVLQALSDALDRNIPLTGLYDGPQMKGVVSQWQRGNGSQDKLDLWDKVSAQLVAKHSKAFNPHQANAFYNFMHNKVLVVDGSIVHTGSFNFSGNATRNAENVINLTDAGLAAQYAGYIEKLVATYKK